MPLPLPAQSSPVTEEERSGALTESEYEFILDSELKSKSRKDATVLAFIDSFVRCKNVAEASAAAGIKNPEGYKIRMRSDVAACIQKLIDKSAIKYNFDASEIMERTKEIVDFDPITLQNPDGTYKSNLHDIEPAARRNIKKMKVRNIWGEDLNKMKIIVGEVIEYEFYDKMKAIDLAGKEKELFKTTVKHEHDVTKDMASILLAASKRGEEASARITLTPPKTFETTGEVVDETET